MFNSHPFESLVILGIGLAYLLAVQRLRRKE